jgi:hypothetical protein
MIGFGVQYGSIKAFDTIGQILFDSYKLRVLSDGGETENRECAINDLNDLV